jgi:hypothetical protein
MTRDNKIQIVFASLPEEERDVERSAAKEFALRTADKFRDEAGANGGDTAGCSSVEICHLAEWKKDQLIVAPTNPSISEVGGDDNDVAEAECTTIVFLISCGPDGSVHRSVRKTSKWIKEQEKKIESNEKGNTKEENLTSDKTSPATITVVVALLGHSVCKTSAEQMEDEVFSSGRRLAKSLQRIVAAPPSSHLAATANAPTFLLETQIELEPPEEKFDGWVQSLVEFLRR